MFCVDRLNDSDKPYSHRPHAGGKEALVLLRGAQIVTVTGLDFLAGLGEMSQASHKIVPLMSPRELQVSVSEPQSLLYRSAVYRRPSVQHPYTRLNFHVAL
jgi:hypothetical protein